MGNHYQAKEGGQSVMIYHVRHIQSLHPSPIGKQAPHVGAIAADGGIPGFWVEGDALCVECARVLSRFSRYGKFRVIQGGKRY